MLHLFVEEAKTNSTDGRVSAGRSPVRNKPSLPTTCFRRLARGNRCGVTAARRESRPDGRGWRGTVYIVI